LAPWRVSKFKDVSYLEKFAQAAQIFKHSNAKHLCLFVLTSVSKSIPLLSNSFFIQKECRLLNNIVEQVPPLHREMENQNTDRVFIMGK